MIKKIIIAIDGHSSTGKSTLAKMLANYLKYKHINTGAMYRAVTLHAMRNGWIQNLEKDIFTVNYKEVICSIDELSLDFRYNEDGNSILFLNGEDIDTKIKSPLVTKYVSKVSMDSKLRLKIVSLQRDIGTLSGVVMEGRDIGSVVFPNADVKLFITASLEVRSKRRYKEMLEMGLKVRYDDVLQSLYSRDQSDTNRKNSPLIRVEDALLIDNTNLDIDEQFDLVLDVLKDKKIIL